MFVDQSTVIWLFPEIVLLAMAIWIYLGGTFTSSRASWGLVSVGAYLVAAVALVQQMDWGAGGGGNFYGVLAAENADRLYSGPLVIDSLGLLTRWLGISVGLIASLAAFRSANRRLASEFFATLMMFSAGIMLSGQANELTFLFVSLELISIPTYILLFLGGTHRGASEATVKYFFLSILSSALLLYGFSFLYGIAGTTTIAGSLASPGIQQMLSPAAVGKTAAIFPLASFALILIFAGLGFKLTIVPWHFYAADVYQGTNNLNAGLLAVGPKLVGTVALVRIIVAAMPFTSEFAWQVVLVLAMLTMTLGNVCALWQSNLRRLLAYSSIAHGGYLLIGLAAGLFQGQQLQSYGGIAAMLFYLLVYSFATLGTFAALTALGGERGEVGTLDAIAGVASSRPGIAAAISVFMFSLAGIPPLAGFWGKLFLFSEALNVAALPSARNSSSGIWFVVLAVIGALNAAIAAAYYLRIVATMYFRSPRYPASAARGMVPTAAVTFCAAIVVVLGVFPSPAARLANSAEKSVLQAEHRPPSAVMSAALHQGTRSTQRSP